MIETTEPAEASITNRIKELESLHQTYVQLRQEALEDACAQEEEMLRTQGAIDELKRLRQEIWGSQDPRSG